MVIVAPVIGVMFRFFADNAVVPQSWKLARTQPVKKKGDLTRISNYRPISLIEVPRKILEGLLLSLDAIEPLAMEQGGFRAKRGTLDQIACLQEWIVQSRSLQGSPSVGRQYNEMAKALRFLSREYHLGIFQDAV